jgi:hypothetical protein
MSFFDGIGDFFQDIAPAAVGAATSFIPGVGPAIAPVAAGATRSLLGGSSGGSSGGNDIQQQQSDMLDKLLGYETPGSRFLEDYSLNVFMDSEDDYLDSKRAQNMFDIISDAVQSENLDPFSAQQFLASKLQPNSEFYSTDDFASLLNAEVGDKKQNRILNDAFTTNFYRAPTSKETRYYKNLASSMGMNKSPMQFSSFLNSRLANTLEAEGKGPLDNYQKAAQAYYGTAIRDADGYKTGTYNVFGRPIIRDDSSKLIA